MHPTTTGVARHVQAVWQGHALRLRQRRGREADALARLQSETRQAWAAMLSRPSPPGKRGKVSRRRLALDRALTTAYYGDRERCAQRGSKCARVRRCRRRIRGTRWRPCVSIDIYIDIYIDIDRPQEPTAPNQASHRYMPPDSEMAKHARELLRALQVRAHGAHACMLRACV